MFFIKLKYRLLQLYFNLILKLGLGNLLMQNSYGERIVVFHGIDKVGETKYNSRFVSESYFEDFIEYIVLHYNVVSLEDYYQKKFKHNTLNIAITFDDGYANNYKYAIPILEKHKVPATFFITSESQFLWPDFLDLVSCYSTKKSVVFEDVVYHKNDKNEFVNNGISLKNKCKELAFSKIAVLYDLFDEEWKSIQSKPLQEYWQLMTEQQIEAISNHPLFSVGSHAKTHANLEKIDLDEAKREIVFSKKKLENICKKTITDFAFPFGRYNKILYEYCESIGLERILLVDYNSEKDKEAASLRNRFVINPYISLKMQLIYLVKGKYY